MSIPFEYGVYRKPWEDGAYWYVAIKGNTEHQRRYLWRMADGWRSKKVEKVRYAVERIPLPWPGHGWSSVHWAEKDGKVI